MYTVHLSFKFVMRDSARKPTRSSAGVSWASTKRWRHTASTQGPNWESNSWKGSKKTPWSSFEESNPDPRSTRNGEPEPTPAAKRRTTTPTATKRWCPQSRMKMVPRSRSSMAKALRLHMASSWTMSPLPTSWHAYMALKKSSSLWVIGKKSVSGVSSMGGTRTGSKAIWCIPTKAKI